MKKSIFVCATCIAMAATYVQAQEAKVPLKPVTQLTTPPPAPPVPPVPPAETIEAVIPVPPVPPAPPAPPDAPEPLAFPEKDQSMLETPVVINSIGYDISRHLTRREEMVLVKKKGMAQKIKLTTWLQNHKYYEKKYGHLPPQRMEVSIKTS